MQNDKIASFTINVAKEVLSDLQLRLKNTRWSSQIEGTDWDAGTDLNYLKQLAAYWQGNFDWRKQEAALNQFHHFKTEVEGTGIHFIHGVARGRIHFPSFSRMAIRIPFTDSRR
jgi:Epoxide hydrolase N terminus